MSKPLFFKKEEVCSTVDEERGDKIIGFLFVWKLLQDLMEQTFALLIIICQVLLMRNLESLAPSPTKTNTSLGSTTYLKWWHTPEYIRISFVRNSFRKLGDKGSQ